MLPHNQGHFSVTSYLVLSPLTKDVGFMYSHLKLLSI